MPFFRLECARRASQSSKKSQQPTPPTTPKASVAVQTAPEPVTTAQATVNPEPVIVASAPAAEPKDLVETLVALARKDKQYHLRSDLVHLAKEDPKYNNKMFSKRCGAQLRGSYFHENLDAEQVVKILFPGTSRLGCPEEERLAFKDYVRRNGLF